MIDIIEVESKHSLYNGVNSKVRNRGIIKGDWNNNYKDIIDDKNVTDLWLNISKGWTGIDYSFLSSLKSIERLTIIADKGENLNSIEGMTELEDLNITIKTKSKIDFTKLKKLSKCFLYFWPGASSIFEVDTLKELYLDKIKQEHLNDMRHLSKLESLTLGNSNVEDLSILQPLKSLLKLELLNCRKIINHNIISKFINLTWLNIDGYKDINSIEFLMELTKLKVLLLSDVGNINSIKPLSMLKELKAFAFPGKTIIVDGDLTVLTSLSKLSMLMFASRRHYTHKLIKKWSWKNLESPDILLEQK